MRIQRSRVDVIVLFAVGATLVTSHGIDMRGVEWFGTSTCLAAEPPTDYLLVAKESRRNWCAARIEWAVSDVGKPEDHTSYFTSQFAGEDHLFIRRGDEAGRQYSEPPADSERADAAPPLAYAERRILRKDGQQYYYIEDTVKATVVDEGDERRRQAHLDINAFGFWPDIRYLHSWDHNPWESLSNWVVEGEGPMIRVSAFPEEGIEFSWLLDPDVGYQPVRSSFSHHGEIIRECVTSYSVHGGHPYPTRVEYQERGVTYKVAAVLDAEFDSPDLPTTLTPACLDIPVGATVFVGGRGLVWDGKKAVQVGEAIERRQSGELDYSRFTQLLEDHKKGLSNGRYPKALPVADVGGQEVGSDPRLWEEFTRRFVRLFALDVDQIARAWQVHAKYRQDALEHLNSHREELASISTKIIQAGHPTDPKAVEELTVLKAKERRLTQPVRVMFEEKVKPQLVKLLTPVQKQRAMEQEAKRPGSTGITALLASADQDRAIEEAKAGERAR